MSPSIRRGRRRHPPQPPGSPPGFAHGFQVTSEYATFCYLCTATYQREHDRSLAWNDPDLDIAWPLASPALSAKDQVAPRLCEVATADLPEA
jgi:dTDP-4-dehydrorhamnose 3,5-epimerase